MQETQLDTKDKVDQLLERYEVPNTPFIIHSENESDSHWVTMGRYRVHEKPFNKFTDAIDYINDQSWDILLQVFAVMIKEQNMLLNELKTED